MEGFRCDSGLSKVDSPSNDNIRYDEPGGELVSALATPLSAQQGQQQQRRLAAGDPEALSQSPADQRLCTADAGGPPRPHHEVDVQPTEVDKQNALVRQLANANCRWEKYCRKQAEEHAAYVRSLDQRVCELERLLSNSRAAEQRLRDAAEQQRGDAFRDQLAAEELHAVLLAQLASAGADPWTLMTAAAGEEEEERPDVGRSGTIMSQQDCQQQHETQTSDEATARGNATSEPIYRERDSVVQPPPEAVEVAIGTVVGPCDDQLTPLLRLQIATLEEDFAHERRDKESERQICFAARQRCAELVRESELLRQKLSAAEANLNRIRKERRQLRKTVEQLLQATGDATSAGSPDGPSRRPCAIAAAPPQPQAVADAANWWVKVSPASKVVAAGGCEGLCAGSTGRSGCGRHSCVVFGRATTPSASTTAAECGVWVVRCR